MDVVLLRATFQKRIKTSGEVQADKTVPGRRRGGHGDVRCAGRLTFCTGALGTSSPSRLFRESSQSGKSHTRMFSVGRDAEANNHYEQNYTSTDCFLPVLFAEVILCRHGAPWRRTPGPPAP